MVVALLALVRMIWEMWAPSLLALTAPLALYGFGQGFVMSPLLNVVLATARDAPAGAVSGIIVTVQQISGAIGIALIGAVYFAVARGRAGFMAAMLALLTVKGMVFLFHWRMSVADIRCRRVEAAGPNATRAVSG